MLEPNAEILASFSEDPPETKPRRAVVVESDAHAVVLEFQEPCQPSAGTRACLFYSQGGRRFRVSATVQYVVRITPRAAVQLGEFGEPKDCQLRRTVRFTSSASGLQVELDGKPARMSDITFDGFGATCSEKFEVDSTLWAVLRYGTEEYRGRVRVRNVVHLKHDGYRYGVETLESAQELQRGLQQITMESQRLRLSHLAAPDS